MVLHYSFDCFGCTVIYGSETLKRIVLILMEIKTMVHTLVRLCLEQLHKSKTSDSEIPAHLRESYSGLILCYCGNVFDLPESVHMCMNCDCSGEVLAHITSIFNYVYCKRTCVKCFNVKLTCPNTIC